MLTDFDTFMLTEEDHLFPRSEGGDDDLDNIVIACRVCNMLKGNYVPEYLGVPTSKNRPEYIQRVRNHIALRRKKLIKDFFSWTQKDDTHRES